MKTRDGQTVEVGEEVWAIVSDGICPYKVRESMANIEGQYYSSLESAAAVLVRQLDSQIIDRINSRNFYARIAGLPDKPII